MFLHPTSELHSAWSAECSFQLFTSRKARTASDAANVRDSAWSDEHAQVEGAAQASEMNEAHL